MDDTPRQRTLKIGGNPVGLCGLDAVLNRVAATPSMSEEAAIEAVYIEISRQNYIPPKSEALYREALRNEYKRRMGEEVAVEAEFSIRILGPGCVSCNKLNTMVFDILQKLEIAADIEQIKELDEIWRHGVLTTPALMINDKVVCSGKMPTPADVEQWIRKALNL